MNNDFVNDTLSNLWNDLVGHLGSDWYDTRAHAAFDAYIEARIAAAIRPTVIKREVTSCACTIIDGQVTYTCEMHKAHFRKVWAREVPL